MKSLKWMALAAALLLMAGAVLADEWVNGVVKRVDAQRGKVTLKHEELKELGMPPMTMVFTLKDPAWAKDLKRGQEVRFQAKDLGGGKLEIEAIEPRPAQ